MNEKDLLQFASQNDPMEIARIIGEPKQPDVKMPYFIEGICDFDTAMPEEYVYYYTPQDGEEYIYVVTSDGLITQRQVTPHVPTLLTYKDIQTPGYFVKMIDLARAKETAVARVKRDMSRAMDKEECLTVVGLLNTGATAASNLFTPDSGQTRFRYTNLVDMIEAVGDYGTNFKLIAGSTVAKDVVRWNFDENKYTQLSLQELGVEMIRVGLKSGARTVNIDDDNSGGVVATDVLAANVAYLVATDTEAGMKPVLFVRKKIGGVEGAGAMGAESLDAMPERYVFPLGGIVKKLSGSQTFIGYEFVGFEEYQAVLRNGKAVAKFTR